jgi:PP-loop superfamily ATP-utilizing enzyme
MFCKRFSRGGPIVVAYSAGVDSPFPVDGRVRGAARSVPGVIANSRSLTRHALADALHLAHDIGAMVEVIRTEEVHDSSYTAIR